MLRPLGRAHLRPLRPLITAWGQQQARSAAQAARPPDAQLLYAVSEAPHHRLLGHVERPERVSNALEALRAAGVLGHSKVGGAMGEQPLLGRQRLLCFVTCHALSSQALTAPSLHVQLAELRGLPPARPDEVAKVHSYVDELRTTCAERAPAAVADIGDPDGVTYVTSSSFDDALRASLVRPQWRAVCNCGAVQSTGQLCAASSPARRGSPFSQIQCAAGGWHSNLPSGCCHRDQPQQGSRGRRWHLGFWPLPATRAPRHL